MRCSAIRWKGRMDWHDHAILFSKSAKDALDRHLRRPKIKSTLDTRTVMNRKATHFTCLPNCMMMRPSNECQEELPRWSNSGVDTWPLMVCRVKSSVGPARTFILDLSSCRVCTALHRGKCEKLKSQDKGFQALRLYESDRRYTYEAKWPPVLNMTVT